MSDLQRRADELLKIQEKLIWQMNSEVAFPYGVQGTILFTLKISEAAVRVFGILFILLTVIPLIEISLLIWLSQATDVLTTIFIVILTGFIGAELARSQGLRTIQLVQQELRQGKAPTSSLADGILILIAGTLLITPGILTDAVGFLLLIPAVRMLLKPVMLRFVLLNMKRTSAGRQSGKGGFVFTQFHTSTADQQPQASSELPSDRAGEVIDVEFQKHVDS